MPHSRVVVLGAAALVAAGCARQPSLDPGDEDFQRRLQERLIRAEPGSTVELPAGRFRLSRTLTLSGRDGITLAGAGMDETVLSFAGQTAGAEGLKVSANRFAIRDLTIQDTKGDAIKIEKAQGVTVRNVKVEWTRGPHPDNGAYGVYPVQCEDVLIEDSVAIGASDAGLYVGQSSRIVLRHNRTERNVAGIEIENSRHADVHDNEVTGNTGGILVFDLPELPVQGGRSVRVFSNRVVANNEPNFAPSGNIVGKVPTGTGIMIMANDDIEVFDNEVRDHRTIGVAVVSYFLTEEEIRDPSYDPYPEAIHVHDNRIGPGGHDPAGGSSLQSKKVVLGMRLALGTPIPDILWDGIVDAQKPEGARICIRNNGSASFANLDAANDFAGVSRDLSSHDCELPRLEAVALEGAAAP